MATSDHQRPPASCSALRRDGGRCRARPLTTGPYCVAHDPDHAHEQAEARRQGGRRSAATERATRRAPEPIRGVLAGLVETFDGVLRGDVDPARARAAASVARAITAVYNCAVIEHRVEQVEDRVEDLQVLGNGKGSLR